MTEADVYTLLADLADGQIFPYVVPLDNQGRPAIPPPWAVFSFVSHVSADTFAGEAETANRLQIDVYARTLAEAREIRTAAATALSPLAPGDFMRLQGYDSATALYRATLEVLLVD